MSELYPGSLQIPAMLYSKAPKGEKLYEEADSKKYIAQLKKDGAWYQLEKSEDGLLYLFSRSISKKTGELSEKIDNVPHLKEWASQLPPGTTLIGEIYYPGGKSNDTTKIMGALPEKAIERQKGNPIHYYVHDMIRYAGKDMLDIPFERRYSDLCEHIDIELKNPQWLEVAKSFTGYGILDTAYRYIREGEEGALFKDKSGLYLPGKRPTYNFKVKEETNEMDFVIIELLPPEKEYTGKERETWKYWEGDTPVTKAWYNNWVGAFRVGAYDDDGNLVATGRVSSGISDWVKEDAAKNPDKYIGQVCVIQAMSVDKENKTMRHSRLLRFHPDKNPKECKIREIFEE